MTQVTQGLGAVRSFCLGAGAFFNRHLFSTVLIGAILLVAWIYLLSGFQVRVRFEAADPGLLQVYWQDPDRGFEPGKENGVRYAGGANDVVVPINGFDRGGKLRIDPLARAGTVRILSVELSGPFSGGAFLDPRSDRWDEEVRLEGDWEHSSRSEGDGILLVADGADPQIIWENIRWERAFAGEPMLWILLLAAGFVVLLERRYPSRTDAFVRRLEFVPFLLVLGTGGALAVALGSTRGIHPDEFVHLDAGEFYEERWLAPVPDDPAARASYSDYGASRLNTREVAYWVAGKFSALAEAAGVARAHIRLRLFNVFLLGVLAMVSILSVRARFVLLPLLLTPQAIYVFGCFNSDAFALTASFLFLIAAVTGGGPVGRLFDGRTGGRPFRFILGGALLALPLGLLKPNFWLLGGFALGYLAVRLFRTPRGHRLAAGVGLAVFAATPVAANLGWTLVVDWRSDFRRVEMMERIRAETAKPIYSPKTPLEELAPGLYLRERGKPLSFLFSERKWHRIAFASSFGNYGYFGVRPTPLYFDRLIPVLGLFLLALFLPTVLRLDLPGGLIFAGAVFSCAMVVAAAVYHSWVSDFQAQGRYLAPVLPILGVLIHENRARFSWWFLGIPAGALILLALYSYWFVAVPGLR
ncbi:MAG: DUF2142 domain-containing protein [Puniceicoccaceae bacterium]